MSLIHSMIEKIKTDYTEWCLASEEGLPPYPYASDFVFILYTLLYIV
jgi:hypothetical protein